MIKTYRYKLYRSKRTKHLDDALSIAAQIYNYCIAIHRRYYRLYHNSISCNALKVHLAKVKKWPAHKRWSNLNSQAIQDVAERIGRSYDAFFSWTKKHSGSRKSPPHFKKRSKYKSFTLKQCGYKFQPDNSVEIMGIKYKYFRNRDHEGTIKTVTIKKNSVGCYFLYVVCDVCVNTVIPRSGNSVGIDFGLKHYLTCSDGTVIDSPLFFKQGSKAIAKLNRNLSHKVKGSNNRKRAILELEREHLHIQNQRRDYLFKLALYLASNYATICIEDLNIKAMQMLWGKKISDLAHAEFISILEYVCPRCGSQLIKVDRFFPSSQLCCNCGYQDTQLKDLSIRYWVCPHCGAKHNRDGNASQNILNEGLRLAG